MSSEFFRLLLSWDLPGTYLGARLILAVVGCGIAAAAGYCLRMQMRRSEEGALRRERERLALEIHDTLAQSFAGIAFQLQVVKEETLEGSAARKQAEAALEMVRRSHQEAKRTIARMRIVPTGGRALDNSGPDCDLLQGLKNAAAALVPEGSLQIDGSLRGQPRRLPPVASEVLFLIGQEAIHNSIRHARPGRIDISLDVREDHAQLSVRDDGCGFDVDAVQPGCGRIAMARRAAKVSADLQVLSAPGAGTAVLATVPLAKRSPLRIQPGHLKQLFTSRT